MATERENSGTLNRNSKGDNPRRPDWRGSINVAGVDYWISAWERTAQRGDKAGQEFLSLSVEPKEQRPVERAPLPKAGSFDVEDDAPF